MNSIIISLTNETMLCMDRLDNNFHIVAIAEKDYRKWIMRTDGLSVISIDKATELFKQGKVDSFIIPAIRRGNVLHTMYSILRYRNIPDECILYINSHDVYSGELISKDRITPFIYRNELDRLELHINDNCNLKCANCSMFAGLVHKEKNADFELTKKSLGCMQKLFPIILEIDILGGEPLLNKDITNYCKLVRDLFPESLIYIVTNGFRIKYLSDDGLNLLKKLNILFSITHYPSFDREIKESIMLLKEKNIEYEILSKRVRFLKLYNFQQKQDSETVFQCCKRKMSIIAMRENLLAACYVPFAINNAQCAFNLEYDISYDVLDLCNSNITKQMVVQKLFKPLSCCRFCHNDSVPWSQINTNTEFRVKDWSNEV